MRRGAGGTIPDGLRKVRDVRVNINECDILRDENVRRDDAHIGRGFRKELRRTDMMTVDYVQCICKRIRDGNREPRLQWDEVGMGELESTYDAEIKNEDKSCDFPAIS